MKNLKPHIGIIGCSSEGAALCYRTICLEGAAKFGQYGHPDVSMHTHCLAEYMKCVEKNDWNGVGDLMLSSAERLQQAGAEILVCPDNTVHEAFDYVVGRSPLPWLHIADVVLKNAKSMGMSKLGVLGTKYLMDGPVYRNACERYGVEGLIPEESIRKSINEIIFEELVKGIFTAKSRIFFHEVIDDLSRKGCDGVVLGCTEIPLIVDPKTAVLPTLDSNGLLARAALEWAKGDQG